MSAIAYVQEGDTLAAIADRYNGVDVDALVELNPTEDGPLDPCADLTGCFESVALPLGSDGYIWYLVSEGDTLENVAALHGQDAEALTALAQECLNMPELDSCCPLTADVSMVPIPAAEGSEPCCC